MKKSIGTPVVVLVIVIAVVVIVLVGYKFFLTPPADTYHYPKNFGTGNPYSNVHQSQSAAPVPK